MLSRKTKQKMARMMMIVLVAILSLGLLLTSFSWYF